MFERRLRLFCGGKFGMVGYPLSGRRASLVERRLCEAETGIGLSRVGPLSELAVFLDT